MKIFNKKSLVTLFLSSLMVMALGLAEPMAALAATTPSLGTATSYAILASSFINTFAGTTVNGDIGFTTGPAVRPLGVQSRYGSGVPYSTAGTDQGAALTNLAAQACTFTFAGGAIDLGTDVTHGAAGIYTPGVYCSSGATSVTGTITLTGAGTYIFRIAGAALLSTAGAIVNLSGASACDVFWTPGQATTLAANTAFKGTVIDDSGITVGANSVWSGRALAFGGTVTTGDTSNIALPVACAGSQAAAPFGPPVVPPLIDVLKVPNPLALPNGSGPVTYTYTVRNIGIVPMTTVRMVDDSCSPLTFQSGDTNNNGALDVTETWIYTCTTTLTATHTNTVTATGFYLGMSSTRTASATVIVGAAIIPPLIHVVKTPNIFLTPAGGGAVTYSYALTNPGTVALSNVTLVDNRCSAISGHTGDIDNDNLLDVSETWRYTCSMNLGVTTTNTATATGTANGLTATDVASATVVVPSLAPAVITAPPLPAAGLAPADKGTAWNIIIPSGIFIVLSSFYLARKKQVI